MKLELFSNLRILIVEDEMLGEGFALDLQSEFSNSHVDWARTHYEALELAQNCAGKPYHVAFLDFYLPAQNRGGEKILDSTILTVLPLETIVIHISTYGDSSEVRPLREIWKNYPQRPYYFEPKGVGFTERAFRQMKTAIATRYFSRWHEELFNADGGGVSRAMSADFGVTSPARPRIPSSSSRNDAAQSFAITEFCVDAAEYWEFLAQTFQEQLKKAFGFAVIAGKPCLGVVSREQTGGSLASRGAAS